MSINLAPLVGHSAVRFAAGLADDRPPGTMSCGTCSGWSPSPSSRARSACRPA